MARHRLARPLFTRIALGVVAMGAAVVSTDFARAEEQRPTMGQLLDEGFEVKSTTLVTAEIVSRNSNATDPDSFIFTLQKGPRLAFCYVTFNTIFGGGPYSNPCSVRR